MQRWAQLPPSTAAAWRALALGLLLSERQAARLHAAGAASLTLLAGPAHAATRWLMPALSAPRDAGQAWLTAATEQLAEFDAPAPRGPGPGLAPAQRQRDLQLALRARRIVPMQRPLLLRAWMLAAQQAGLTGHTGTGDALHLACLVLDLPMPEALVN